jgi:hypothetical protein
MPGRRLPKHTAPLKERLASWADEIRQQAEQLPPGPEREALLKKAGQAEMAARMDDWASSPGLQPPT